MAFRTHQAQDALRDPEVDATFKEPIDMGEIHRAAAVALKYVSVKSPLLPGSSPATNG